MKIVIFCYNVNIVGEYFKITAEDCNSDGILRLVCPACGLESENYFTQDVVDLALTIIKNYVMDEIFNAFKDLEKSASGKKICDSNS